MSKMVKGGRALNKNEKLLLTTLFLVSVLFIYYTIFLGPSLKKLDPIKGEVKELKSQLANSGNLSAEIKTKEEELANLKATYEDASKAMPKGDRYPELSKELKDKASKEGISISSMVFSKPEIYNTNAEEVPTAESTETSKADGLLQYNVSLSLKGTLDKAMNFIKVLEEDKRIMKVENITSTNDKVDITLSYIVTSSDEEENYDFN